MITSLDIIRKLSATSKRNDKISILEEAWKSGERTFFHLAMLTLDPTITFGVKQIPESRGIINPARNADPQLFVHLCCHLKDRVISGNAAKDAIEALMKKTPADVWNEVYRNVLKRDLRCGVDSATINKVLKQFIPDSLPCIIPEFPYMRCCLLSQTKIENFDWHRGVYSQVKSDGMFININLIDDEVFLVTRNGKQFPLDELSELEDQIRLTLDPNTQTHGEMLVLEDGVIMPREKGNGVLNSVLKGGTFESNQRPIVSVWDQIPSKYSTSKGEYNVGYSIRFKDLESQVLPKDICSGNRVILLTENKIVHSMDEALSHYRECLSRGLEGTIIKAPDAPWKDGTNKKQVKLKLEVPVELEVTGYNPGEGKNADTFGSLVCKSSCGELEVNISGFTDKKRKDIFDNMDNIIGKIVTVNSNSLLEPSDSNSKYSLFLPRYEEFREDKDEADDITKIKLQFQNALKV